MVWNEHVKLEGGPKWNNEYSGRADYALVRPVDSVDMFPNRKDGVQTYVRTTRAWLSPLYGTIHTIFTHEASGAETVRSH